MNIRYGKVAVYVLTFLGYIYSGYGSGLLDNLREAIGTAEVVFGDVMKKVVTVAQKFRTMHDVFDMAVEEDCIFKCPTGAQPKPNKNHIPSSNGCGSLGLKIESDYLPFAAMEGCCNSHDICYDTCNRDKEVCDLDFKRCLYKHCDGYAQSVGGQTMTKGAQPKPNKNHIPSSNGCGSLGLNIESDYLPFAAMEGCCNSHDICYDTCNRDKEVCDLDFKRCLYKHCDGYAQSVGGQTMTKACKGAAKMLFTGTLTLGCKSYMDAQKEACYCPPGEERRWKDKKKSKYTPGGDRNEL